MEYISIKEAAEKRGLSQRSAQIYYIDGRIEGAVKLSGIWAIPADAEKPATVKKEARKKPKTKTVKAEQPAQKLRTAMPLINTPYKPGEAAKSIEKIEDEDTRRIALAEYYYFSGRSAKASDIAEEYLTNEDIAIRLSACWLYGYANLALDRIPRARQAIALILKTTSAVGENTLPPPFTVPMLSA